MEKKYYLIEVEGGVEAFTEGPFETEKVRDRMAKLIRPTQEDDDSLFWADVDERGALTVGSYKARFFFDDPAGRAN
jgi:hypothetical protein